MIRALVVEGEALSTAGAGLTLVLLSTESQSGECLREAAAMVTDPAALLLRLSYTQRTRSAAGGHIFCLGGPDVSLGFQGAIKGALRCVSRLCEDDQGHVLFSPENGDEAREDSDDEAEASYMERILETVSKEQGSNAEGGGESAQG